MLVWEIVLIKAHRIMVHGQILAVNLYKLNSCIKHKKITLDLSTLSFRWFGASI